jgi:hypothetical protein
MTMFYLLSFLVSVPPIPLQVTRLTRTEGPSKYWFVIFRSLSSNVVWPDIGNARVSGLQKDLHMTDRQYQVCVTVLYVYVGTFLSLIGCAHCWSAQKSIYSCWTSSKSPSPQDRSENFDANVAYALGYYSYFSRWIIEQIGASHFFSPECEGFVTSYKGLATVRAFLGLVEGPMFPGIVLYLSGFYTREELSLR